jgi:hypothetical protein
MGGSNTGFKHHSGAARTLFEHIQAVAVPDLYQASVARIPEPVTVSADKLVEKTGGDSGCDNAEDAKSYNH